MFVRKILNHAIILRIWITIIRESAVYCNHIFSFLHIVHKQFARAVSQIYHLVMIINFMLTQSGPIMWQLLYNRSQYYQILKLLFRQFPFAKLIQIQTDCK